MPDLATTAAAKMSSATAEPARPRATPARARRPLPHNPLVLWHLLSLDAPSVAALWTTFVAASVHLALPPSVPISMFLAVWMLYVADRLLDSRILIPPQAPRSVARSRVDVPDTGLEARHYFHHRHRRPLLAALALCAAALASLLPRLHPAAIRLDLLLASLLFAYFVLIHATGSAHRLPKEISVGLFFSAAVTIPTVARLPMLRLQLLPLTLLFAMLCSLNCLFIYRWEHPRPLHAGTYAGPPPHPLTRIALGILTPLCLALAGTGVLLSFALHQPALLALALSAALLLVLDRCRSILAPLTLRSAADLVLLTPLLFLFLKHAS